MMRQEKTKRDEMQLCPENQKYRGKTAVVVGSGPAGSTAAIYLARQGFRVEVYEGRDDIRQTTGENKKSYSVGLLSSITQVMREIGVTLPDENGDISNGYHRFYGLRHISPNGSIRQVNLPSNRYLGTRSGIAKSLVEAIAEKYSDKVKLHFRCKCKDVHFAEQRVVLEDSKGNRLNQSYDLLVAADGAHSIIRKRLMEFDKSFTTDIVHNLSRYVVIDDFTLPDEKNIYTDAIGLGWVVVIGLRVPPGGKKMRMGEIYIFQMLDGGIRIRPSGPIAMFELIKQGGIPMARKIFPKDFPEPWTESICKVIESSELFSLPSIIHVSRFNGPKTLLIGDAAHGMSPNTGQGCTLAIEDGKVLYEALEVANGSIDLALKIFNEERYEEVQCCLLLEEGFTRYLLQLTGWRLLWRYMAKTHRGVRTFIADLLNATTDFSSSGTGQEMTSKATVWAIQRDCLAFFGVSLCGILWMMKVLYQFISGAGKESF